MNEYITFTFLYDMLTPGRNLDSIIVSPVGVGGYPAWVKTPKKKRFIMERNHIVNQERD
jgi:hypothetical protein